MVSTLDARTNQGHRFDSSYTVCQVPRRDGTPCFNEPDPSNPWGVCRTHWKALAEAWQPANEDRKRMRCIGCGKMTAIARGTGSAFCIDPACGTSFSLRDPAAVRQAQATVVVNVVYYMRFADRIKIGTTTNLLSRSKSVFHDEVLAIEPGDATIERGRHRQFATLLIPGQREWFKATPDLQEHAAALRAEHGDPFTAFRTWYETARKQAA